MDFRRGREIELLSTMTFWHWHNHPGLFLENSHCLGGWIKVCLLVFWQVWNSAWADIRLYQHTQSGFNRSCDWELLSCTKLFCLLPLLFSILCYTTRSPPSAFALLWQRWMTPIVLGTLQPTRQTSSFFLSQSSPWGSPSSVCPQSQSRSILLTNLYHLVHLHIFSPRGDAGSVGANGEWLGSCSSQETGAEAPGVAGFSSWAEVRG